MDYDISNDIIGHCSIRSAAAAAFGHPRCCSGLAATLPCLCHPEPALAETPAPDPLRLGNRNHPGPGVALTVAPHPDVHLVELVVVTPVPLRVSGGVSKTPIVLEAVWDSGVTVAADEARNEGAHPTTFARNFATRQK
jgi:hypothetical protein